MTRASRALGAALGLALGLSGAGCLSAMSGGASELGAPPDTGWLGARVGVGFLDTLQIDLDEPTQGVTSPLAFGVGAHYRTSRIDVGGLFEGTGGQRHGRGEGDPIGASFRAAGTLRWRYLEESWGALYMGLAPAFMVLGHSDQVRDEIGEGERDAVDDHTLAFSLGAGVGLLFYLSDRAALSLGVDLVTAATSVGTAARDVSYNAVRGLVTVGMEWRM